MSGDAASAGRSRPFLLATFLDGDPTEGGGYVHKRSALGVLRRLESADLRVLVICDRPANLDVARAAGLDGVVRRRGVLTRVLGVVAAFETVKVVLGRTLGPSLSPVDRLLRRSGADLVFFSGPDSRALELYTQSYVFSVWDLCHLEHPDFPEVSQRGELERRERLYTRALRGAVAVIADSEHGRGLIANAYGVPRARVHVAPFLVGSRISAFSFDAKVAADVEQRYRLTNPYIFYPAQFWHHKNHGYILRTLRLLLDRYGWAPQAVFSGSDRGALAATLEYAKTLGVEHLVNYCGFVPDEHLPYLYRGALALVMPTYFGPTNMPPLEALSFGTPVCYSDLPGFREQFGDAVRYVDLARPESLAAELDRIRAAGPAARPEPRPDDLAQAEERYFAVVRDVIAAYRLKTARPPAPL